MKEQENIGRCRRAMAEWIDLSMHISMRSYFSHFRKLGLSHSQISVIHLLYHRGECTVGDVSRMLSVSNPAASQLLDHLVSLGAVERYESSQDRRVRLHKLTEDGLGIIRKSRSGRSEWYYDLFDDMSDEEIQLASDALEMLNGKIKNSGKYGRRGRGDRFGEHRRDHRRGHRHGDFR